MRVIIFEGSCTPRFNYYNNNPLKANILLGTGLVGCFNANYNRLLSRTECHRKRQEHKSKSPKKKTVLKYSYCIFMPDHFWGYPTVDFFYYNEKCLHILSFSLTVFLSHSPVESALDLALLLYSI